MYDAFNNALARSESGGNYSVVNDEGFGGKYQFGQPRLDDFNRANGTRYSVAELVANPQLQEIVQDWHVGDIDSFILQNGLEGAIGQNINGTVLTRDSLRAMAHLGGKEGMRRFVSTGGQYNPSDSNGTSLSDYARSLGGTGQPENALAAPNQPPQRAENALAPQRPQFQVAALDAANFAQPLNRLAPVGFDRNTNPFHVG